MTAPAAGALGAAPRTWTAIAGAVLLGVLAGCFTNWWAGAAVVALGLVVIARPLDLFVAMVLVTCAGAFAEYGDPHITRDLAIVATLAFYAGLSLLASMLTRRWRMPTSPLTRALLALMLTTFIGTVHGILVRNPVRNMALELFPLSTLFLALGVGGLRVRGSDLRIARNALILVALISSGIGFRYYALTGMRTQGLPFSPVPGMVAILVLSVMLFEPSRRPRLLPVVLFCIMICHQIVTFTRGFWFGLLAGLPVVLYLYAGRGAGARVRWRKVLSMAGLVALVMLPIAIFASSMVGWAEIVNLLGSRFASSFETKNTPETVSNIARLVELRATFEHIRTSPVLGLGHGASQLVRQFIYPTAGAQWWVHETYVMIWFKQGIIGLLALLWVLVAAVRMGVTGARHPDPQVAGWCAASAGCTVFSAVVGLTNYYFFMVTITFLLALLWGVSIASSEPAHWRFVWRRSGTSSPRSPGTGA